MNKKLLFFVAGFLTVGVLSYILGIGLFSNPGGLGSNRIPVSASFYPMYYFASEIGGDKVEVANITPAGSEPHDYEPTPKDIANLQKSNLIIVNGGGLEPWFEKIKGDLEGKTIVVASEGLNLREGQPEEGDEGEVDIKDPHTWLDPVLARSQVDKILSGLISADPENKPTYEENAGKLKERLGNLDNSFRNELSSCTKRDFVTSHTAFAYLADRYGLNQVAISGLSPDEEPSPAELVSVTNFARENNVKYIFFETLVSPKLSETIANEVGAQTLVLDPIEGLSDDDIESGKSYFTVMESNLRNLQIALECNK